MIPTRVYIPTPDSLEYLWDMFNSHRNQFPDDLAATEIQFFCWIASSSTVAFTLGESDTDPDGIFIFSELTPGKSAAVHLFIWNKGAYNTADIVDTARVVCMAVMKQHQLARLNGLTPVTHPHALRFAKWVGFKVEGELRDVVVVGGKRVNAWVSGLLPQDVGMAAAADKLEEEG